jgi:hypothetical protein
MKLKIVGDGSFGSFLKELLTPHFELTNDADSVILAVPISAYDDVASKHRNKHLINVCSVQKPSTDICLKHSERVTSIHPLFGRRTPVDKRNSILTYEHISRMACNDTWYDGYNIESDFLIRFRKVSNIIYYNSSKELNLDGNLPSFTPELHDILMRDFVKTLEDMPSGTVESIMANPYI